MASDGYPTNLINTWASISFVGWSVLPSLVHAATARAWPAYKHLPRHVQIGWCNRIGSAAHAIMLVAAQSQSLCNSHLWAEPLTAVSDAHFFWGSVMLGYLVYDTSHLLRTWKDAGRLSFLVHHLTALACVVLGIYGGRLAVFGMATQVAFELTTPLLHTLGCLKVAGRHRTKLYVALSAAFFLMFLICRVITASLILGWMAACVMALPSPKPVWAWAGLALYCVLCAVNFHWFAMLCSMARKMVQPQRTSSTALKELTAIQSTAELVRSFSGPLRLRMKASDPLASRFALLKAGNRLEDRSSGEHLIRARLPSGA
ncbi:hypothetical protein WJX84_000688 [Apatococcus fuscideae]|uniref:TLC domain-containing protein n=1 Tax=Apatococcus fuscideae TaxID=2026836 RepID=A0AAW1SQ56_9CHLO